MPTWTSDGGPGDLTVVVPTHRRWTVLARTLEALRAQTVQGFEVVVVVDGADDVDVPAGLAADRVLTQAHAGPGAARNRGVAASDRPLVLFLGDDMIPAPGLVERHLAVHRAEPDDRVAVLGRVAWHPEVARDRLLRWLEWSGGQFDYRSLDRSGAREAGFGRFYSCNVSLKRALFDATGGFDADFTFDYEDLDLGYRLDREGMRLRYEPAALVHHLHRYDWAGIEARHASRARAERLMMAKHAWFVPWFHERIRGALLDPPVSSVWPRVIDRVPLGPARPAVERRADRWYLRRLAPAFFDAWDGDRDLEELRTYLGGAYDHGRLERHRDEVDAEAGRAPDEATFYRTSEAYLYDLTAFAMSGTKTPYLADLSELVAPGARLLDYGCGIGSDGLRLLAAGYRVELADFDNPSTRFLRWRLARRGLDAPVHDLEGGVPGGFDVAYSFDVIEHVDDPVAFLGELESRAGLVVVNLLEPDPHEHDAHVHRPLPIPALLDRAAARGLLRYRRYHGRSHLLAYRGDASGAPRVGGWRSRWERVTGARRHPPPRVPPRPPDVTR